MTEAALHLSVRSAEKELFSGSVMSVSSINERGRFDVLSFHENFISIIKDGIFIKLPEGQEKIITIDTGIMMVEENRVAIYVGLGSN